jgi:hypothetical protein
MHRNGPATGDMPGPLVSELRLGGGLGGQVSQPRFLHSGMR